MLPSSHLRTYVWETNKTWQKYVHTKLTQRKRATNHLNYLSTNSSLKYMALQAPWNKSVKQRNVESQCQVWITQYHSACQLVSLYSNGIAISNLGSALSELATRHRIWFVIFELRIQFHRKQISHILQYIHYYKYKTHLHICIIVMKVTNLIGTDVSRSNLRPPSSV
jgi:hypothetical protein